MIKSCRGDRVTMEGVERVNASNWYKSKMAQKAKEQRGWRKKITSLQLRGACVYT